MKRAYIAGKIEGDPNYQNKFHAASDLVKVNGCLPLNPAVLPEGMDKAFYMRVCFSMIDAADMVCLLPDWETSQGARLEMMYAEYTGKQIVFLGEGVSK